MPDSDLRIRPAAPADSAALARIQVDSFRSAYAGILPDAYLQQFSYAEQTDDWRDLLTAATDDVLLVAERAGAVVGYALGRAGVSEPPGYDGELVALHVHRDQQQRGIGRKLIAAVGRALHARGCRTLVVWVLADNPARALYAALGGEPVAAQPWPGNADYGVAVEEVAYGWRAMQPLFRVDFEHGDDVRLA